MSMRGKSPVDMGIVDKFKEIKSKLEKGEITLAEALAQMRGLK